MSVMLGLKQWCHCVWVAFLFKQNNLKSWWGESNPDLWRGTKRIEWKNIICYPTWCPKNLTCRQQLVKEVNVLVQTLIVAQACGKNNLFIVGKHLAISLVLHQKVSLRKFFTSFQPSFRIKSTLKCNLLFIPSFEEETKILISWPR